MSNFFSYEFTGVSKKILISILIVFTFPSFCIGQNRSLQLDGIDDYVELSQHASDLIFDSPFTIEFWLKENDDHRSNFSCIWNVSDGIGYPDGEEFSIYSFRRRVSCKSRK